MNQMENKLDYNFLCQQKFSTCLKSPTKMLSNTQQQLTEANFDPESTKQQGADAYTFSAEPRAVQNRKKFRDVNEAEQKSP